MIKEYPGCIYDVSDCCDCGECKPSPLQIWLKEKEDKIWIGSSMVKTVDQ